MTIKYSKMNKLIFYRLILFAFSSAMEYEKEGRQTVRKGN
jgi:hypothetical protein